MSDIALYNHNTPQMAEFFDMSSFLSAEEREKITELGESMIRATLPSNRQANHANTHHNLRRLDVNVHTLPSPLAPHEHTSQTNFPYPDNPYRDHPDIAKPIDWSKVKKFRKWDYDP